MKRPATSTLESTSCSQTHIPPCPVQLSGSSKIKLWISSDSMCVCVCVRACVRGVVCVSVRVRVRVCVCVCVCTLGSFMVLRCNGNYHEMTNDGLLSPCWETERVNKARRLLSKLLHLCQYKMLSFVLPIKLKWNWEVRNLKVRENMKEIDERIGWFSDWRTVGTEMVINRIKKKGGNEREGAR